MVAVSGIMQADPDLIRIWVVCGIVAFVTAVCIGVGVLARLKRPEPTGWATLTFVTVLWVGNLFVASAMVALVQQAQP